jgi:hypothetical protein
VAAIVELGSFDAMTPRGARLTGLVLAIALGQFLFLRAREAWTNHWLLKDARQGTAVVTKELWSGHNAVGYEYSVDQRQYAGRSGRNWKDQKKVLVGEQTTVYYSASHPSLSLLYMPEGVLAGLPVIIIALVIEAFAVITIIKPKSGWAFSLIGKEQKAVLPQQDHHGNQS